MKNFTAIINFGTLYAIIIIRETYYITKDRLG